MGTPGSVSRRLTGGAGLQAAEKHTVIMPSRYSGGAPLVLLAGAVDGHSFSSVAARRDADQLVRRGCIVIAADFGSPALWYSDTQLTRVGEMIAYAAAVWGAKTTRVSWVGESRGGGLALNWGWRHPSQLGGIVGQCPAVALQSIHDRNPLGTPLAEIEASYGGNAAYLAALPTHDPSHANQVAPITAIAGRCLFYKSSDDTVVIPADIDNLAASTGVRVRSLGAMGHDPWSAGNTFSAAQADFIVSQL